MHLLEEEKFRKQFTKRYPRLGELLHKEIGAWEEQHGRVFLYDGLNYRDVLEAEDTSRLDLDLKKVGKAKTSRPKETAASLMRASGSTPTKLARTSTKGDVSPRGEKLAKTSRGDVSPRADKKLKDPNPSPRAAAKRVRSMKEAAANPPDLSKTAPVGFRALSVAPQPKNTTAVAKEDEVVESPRKLRKSLSGDEVRKSLGSEDIANLIHHQETELVKTSSNESLELKVEELSVSVQESPRNRLKRPGSGKHAETPTSSLSKSRIKTPTVRRSARNRSKAANM